MTMRLSWNAQKIQNCVSSHAIQQKPESYTIRPASLQIHQRANHFPAKLTQFLYKRFEAFPGDVKKGFIILSCELIDNNGKGLEKCVLKHAEYWNLGADFISWIKEANLFCSTLVDRIVTGYPRSDADALNQENGYIDRVLNTGGFLDSGSSKVHSP